MYSHPILEYFVTIDDSLDETFGNSGLVRKGFLASGVQVMAIQKDGKILIGSDNNSENSDFILN